MTDIRFYHLERSTLEQVLPSILSKALDQGRNIVVKTPEAEKLSEHLWIYRPDAFIPHGTYKDEHKALQPVYLTPDDENPNAAKVLILTGGEASSMLGDFDLCCEMFDGRDEAALKSARARWKEYESAGHTLTYWQQTDKGWEQKK